MKTVDYALLGLLALVWFRPLKVSLKRIVLRLSKVGA
jgi:hypothetical protein